jgi:putative phosphoribosyl transferase
MCSQAACHLGVHAEQATILVPLRMYACPYLCSGNCCLLSLFLAGGGAALWAAAYMGPRISAVVVRGGRPDLAAAKLPAVTAPTLLLVGSEDTHVLQCNNTALQMMGASDSSQVVVVPGAGHLFEGPGQLEAVADLAVQWFRSHMGADGDE